MTIRKHSIFIPTLLCLSHIACSSNSTQQSGDTGMISSTSGNSGTGASTNSGSGASAGASGTGATAITAPQTASCEIFEENRTVGTRICDSVVSAGYTLFSPLGSLATYLIDIDGRVVHQWAHTLPPGQVVRLLEDGRLLRSTDPGTGLLSAGGEGGGVELIDWDGKVLWSFDYFTDDYRAHHDLTYMPNGNIMMIAWERIDSASATAAGRRTTLGAGELWPDHLIEVHPESDGSASIVWQWHAWDHLVQNNDASLPTYGEAVEHPGRIDVDFGGTRNADWLHINAVHYDEAHDQLILSVHNTSEVWIIDHSITSEEAKGAAGDILYRWGNPAVWGAGTAADRTLFLQHDTQLISDGFSGAGHLLLFNNGDTNFRNYSSVDEIVLPRAADGSFERLANGGLDQVRRRGLIPIREFSVQAISPARSA